MFYIMQYIHYISNIVYFISYISNIARLFLSNFCTITAFWMVIIWAMSTWETTRNRINDTIYWTWYNLPIYHPHITRYYSYTFIHHAPKKWIVYPIATICVYYMYVHVYIYIHTRRYTFWVNYDISLSWIKAIQGMISLNY